MVLCRDRTSELQSIFQRVKTQQRSNPAATKAPPAGPRGSAAALTPQAQRFAEASQSFSRELASTSHSIANLTKLIQSQNVFEDQAPEIGKLTTIVKSKLSQLHTDLNTLTEMREQAVAGPSTAQPARHSDAIVSSLRSKLVATSQSFKSLLQGRTKTLKDTNMRRNRFTSDRPTTFESALMRQEEQAAEAQGQTQSMQHHNVQHFRQRHEAVRQIEAAVTEVGEMFQDFTRLVHEQDETIVRIDADVDSALQDVHAGNSELMKYLSSLTSGRGMMLKIFAVLFVFLLFFGFIVVR